MPWQKSVDVHQNPARTSPTHLSTHSYPTLISKKHHMLTSREKCGLEEPLGLHFEVLADSVDAHFGGGGFDDQDSLAAQLRHRFAAAFEHLLGGGGAEHFFLGGGPALGEGVEFGVLEQHEDDEVLAHQLRGGGDEFGAAGAVGHLRDPDDQAAAALHVLETGDGVEVVGFGGFAAGLAEEVDQQAEVEAWSSCVTVSRWARSCSVSVSCRNCVPLRLRSKAVRERRPASRTIQTCCERSTVNWRVMR